MNAAARLVHQNVLSRHLALTHFLSRKQITILLLAIAIVLSSIALIYTTHLSRSFYAGYQRTLAERNQLHTRRTQLLLEHSTLLMQARVQVAAEQKLDMVPPDQTSTIVIHE